MAIVHRDRPFTEWPTSILPERWRRLFDFDLEQDGWLRMEEYRDGDDLVMRAEIPDIDPDKDIEVLMEDGRLTVRAHREAAEERKGKSGFRSEFRYGELSRTVRVPEGVDVGDVKATYSNGILEVRVPVPAEKGPEQKRITVKRS